MRSSPAPVSIDGLGSGVRVPSGAWSYCMKTRFQNSMNRSPCGSRSGPAVGAEVRTAVEVQLGARAAWPRLTHLPEVVLVAEALDALHRHADDVVPDLLGLVVALVDGDPDAVAVEAPVLGDELPAVGDGQFLEVVPEAEVAHHLEEDEMALGAADVVEVVVLATGADALLRADGPPERRDLVADEVRLEGHHAGHVEQHGRVVRDEAGRRHRRVFASGEEVDEGLAELRPRYEEVERPSELVSLPVGCRGLSLGWRP